MHFQSAPHQEAKLVRCSHGAIYDVIIDLRPQSPTFKRHFAISLTSLNRLMLYMPEDFAHGFLTLEDSTEVFYQMSEFFCSESLHEESVGTIRPSAFLGQPRSQSFPNAIEASRTLSDDRETDPFDALR